MRLKVEKLVYGGLGLCRTDNGIVFIDQVLPGELVEGEVGGKRGGALIARLDTVLEESPYRIKPSCEYYGVCGGCDWQYIDYNHQIQLKHDIFVDCLKRIGKIETIPGIEIVSSAEWQYRIRAQLKVDAGKGGIGFFKRRTNGIVTINTCPLLDPQIDRVLQNQGKFFFFLSRTTKQLKVIAGSDGSVASKPVIKDFTQDTVKISVAGAVFSVHGESFFQGNRFLLQKLGNWAKQYVSGGFFIDMYGGLGFFSVLLGSNFSKGLLVESVKEQVMQATKNLRLNLMDHIAVKTMTAEAFFHQPDTVKTKPELLIVDPPRPGLSKIVRDGIRDLKPSMVLYVSCNPSTQARDIGFLINTCGFSIERAALFDMYPHTHHLETVLLLKAM